MTNYEMLTNRNALVDKFGEDFVKEWYDGPSYSWHMGPFDYGSSRDSKPFFTAARMMHDTWLALWNISDYSKRYSDKSISFDFGWWLFKDADIGLLVPQGAAVCTEDGKIGIVSHQWLLSGNYAIEKVWVDFASGMRDVHPKDIKKADIPDSLMEFARAMAIREFKGKCPIAGEV